jgi:NAD(P)-dependent dehydrogenase (short-subunit alcohol dehydrogenase family)
MGRLDGKVALITGGARGMGKSHVRHFVAEGARVVFGDVLDDKGEKVAAGLDERSCRYVHHDVTSETDWAAAVATALDAFGKLDVLVNNAGILRDSFIPGMDESQWDAVIAVHLKGHFATLHHAAEYWKARTKAGDRPSAAVINTASGSGTTLPNPGQANYGSAKAAIAALTLVAAAELDRYGVRVNAIAPIARTRLTLATPGMGNLMAEPDDGSFDLFSPANISPLVAYLAMQNCPITGQVYAVQGGAISQLGGWHDVATIETDALWHIDDIAARLPR